jgi:hypothetical protein
MGRFPAPSTPLGRALDRLEQLTTTRYKASLRRPSLRDILLDASGADILTHVLRHAEPKLGATFVGHWPLLTQGEVLPTREGPSGTARNKIWELFVGALCTHFATEVQAEEPDVTCNFLRSRIGVACKCLYSTSPAKQAARIVEGARQIEASNVDFGFILANIVNLLPHTDLIDPKKLSERDYHDPVARVDREAKRIFTRLPLAELWTRLSDGDGGPRTKTRAVLFFAPALVPAPEVGLAMAMPIAPFFFRMVASDLDLRFAEALGTALGHDLTAVP